jgi:RES domain-containing protein
MLLFRISKNAYANKLTASGRQNRWNTEGKLVVYTASSLSLACLETVVHGSPELLYNQDYKSVVIEIPLETSATIIDINNLPENWREREKQSFTQNLGDKWYLKQETLLLKVSSVIISREFNYLINTKHPDFSKVFISEINSFMFDKRIKS